MTGVARPDPHEPNLRVRDATEADLPAVVDIYNQSIPAGWSTADTTPITVADRVEWFRKFDPARRPIWVAEADGSVVAVAYLSSFYGDLAAVLRGDTRAASATRDCRKLLRSFKDSKVDVVIADPSRTGLGRDGARTVLACDPERVVLVSCDAAALARDVGLLVGADYKLTSVRLVDLFAHTPHIECVTILDR